MDLRILYQEIIVDHSRAPRNNYSMEGDFVCADGYNPLCGDQLKLFLKIEGEKIVDASFVGSGCAISTASASLMTETLIGKTVLEAKQLFDEFHDMVTVEKANYSGLGKLEVLAGVKQFPSRVKCATLAWHTLIQALENKKTAACTE
jgi:nitrogen fixation protein NifU and related proteins